MDVIHWFVGVLGESIPFTAVLLVGYWIGGAIGVYVLASLLFAGLVSSSTYSSTGSLPYAPDVLAIGFLIPLALAVPAAALQYISGKHRLPFLPPFIAGVFMWFFIVVLAQLAGFTFYSISVGTTCGMLSFALLRHGLSVPWFRTKDKTSPPSDSDQNEENQNP